MNFFFYKLKYILNNHKSYKKKNSKKIILVELFDYKASIISNAIFSNELSKKYKAKLVGYVPMFSSFKKKIKQTILRINPFSFYNLYKSFGISSYVFPSPTKTNKVEKTYEYLVDKIKSKDDILKIKIENIYVGDLIYDNYLRDSSLSTINYKDKSFKKFLYNAILLFFYWDDYYKNNNVKALVVSHSVYLIALPARIALNYNIEVFNLGFSSAYRLKKNQPLKFSYFEEYPKLFNKIKKIKQKQLLSIAKKNINLRLSGQKDIL